MKKSNVDYFPIILILVLFVLIFGYTLILTLFTKFTKTITIKDKYIRNSSRGRGNYFIVDSDNNSYVLSDNLFLLEFNKTDDYNRIEKNKTYKIYGYGFRIQFLSMYPKIYDLIELK